MISLSPKFLLLVAFEKSRNILSYNARKKIAGGYYG